MNLQTEPRLFNMDPDLSRATAKQFCAVCSRTLKKAPNYYVWSTDFIDAVHPDDVHRVNSKNTLQCALVPIGNECAKKFPPEFLIPRGSPMHANNSISLNPPTDTESPS